MLGPYISLIADNSTNAPYVLIGTGTVIIVFGLFGCFATCRGSPWMLKLVRGCRRKRGVSCCSRREGVLWMLIN